jgi:predicted transcriptional regulator
MLSQQAVNAYIKEEVREDGYMQAGLRVQYYCC